MPFIAVRPKASEDLAEIWAYIARDSLRRADAMSLRFDREFRSLARRPGIGRSRPELCLGLRSISVRSYVVFYFPRRHGIEIVRVLHGARDVRPLFAENG